MTYKTAIGFTLTHDNEEGLFVRVPATASEFLGFFEYF